MSFKSAALIAAAIAAPILLAAPAVAQYRGNLPPMESVAVTWTESSFVAADGTRIYYYEQGEGTPVILIHGLTSSGLGNWFRTGIAQEVAKSNRVIAVDMRGHGKTGDPAAGATGYMINDIVQLMDHLRIDRAHIAGYSMGGATTSGLMREAPERFITAGVLGIGITHAPGASGPEANAAAAPNTGPAMRAPRGAPAPSQRVDLTTIDFPVIAINGTNDNPGKVEPLFRHVRNFTNILLPEQTHMSASGDPVFAREYASFVREHNPR